MTDRKAWIFCKITKHICADIGSGAMVCDGKDICLQLLHVYLRSEIVENIDYRFLKQFI